MKTIIILGNTFFLPVLRYYISNMEQVLVIAADEAMLQTIAPHKGLELLYRENLTEKQLFRELPIAATDRIVICFTENDRLKACLDALRSIHQHAPVIVMGQNRQGLKKVSAAYNTVLFSAENLVQEQLNDFWSAIDNRTRLEQLKAINQETGNVLILVQDDPDPDALASGLALRVLLGRNKQTAPIGSFGAVTRSENVNMSRLLDIPVLQITPDELKRFSKIALVDVQPPYFKNVAVKADIVFDHHPISEPYTTLFSDIRVSYGSTSTILGKYLIDGGYKITQRLATSLLYGIKTDTMFLERDISDADIEVFTSLYPMANLNMLRQIEHAMLEYHEISSFVKALKNITVVEKMQFCWLGRVERDDIIPRIADFCLQIGGAEWAFVTGVHNRDIICCVRNVGYVKHAGELVQRAFGMIGSAGGHRSMAKAVMQMKKMNQRHAVTCMAEIEKVVIQCILDSLDD